MMLRFLGSARELDGAQHNYEIVKLHNGQINGSAENKSISIMSFIQAWIKM